MAKEVYLDAERPTMQEPGWKEISRRLEAIEHRLDEVERVAGIAKAPPVAPAPPAIPSPLQEIVPPPVVSSPPPPPPRSTAWVFAGQTSPPPPPPPPSVPAVDREYQIGAQIMPKVGGVAFIAGIGYLVSLGLSRGLITPAILFSGAVLVSLAFIIVGLIKRNEREEFGQVLVGVGSCGLYVTFAAGHVFQNLYDGRTLVLLFFLLSVANLGFSLWRASRVFLGIGLLGGLASALMPLQEGKAALDVGLHFLILVPAALIAARHRWPDMAMTLYGAATLALLPVAFFVRAPWELRVLALYGTALVSVASYAFAYRRLAFDPQSVFAPCALVGTALLAFGVQGNREGALHLLAYGAFAAAFSLLLSEDIPARERVAVGGVAVALGLAPFGLGGLSPFVHAGLATLCAGFSLRALPKAASGLAAALLGLGLGTYLLRGLVVWSNVTLRFMPWEQEVALLLLFVAATVSTAYALVKTRGEAEAVTTLACLLVGPLVARLVQSTLGLPTVGADPILGAAVGLLTASAALLVLAHITRWTSSNLLVAFGLMGGLGCYLTTFAFTTRPPAVSAEVPIALAFAAVVSGAAYVSGWRSKVVPHAKALGVASLVVGALVVRLGRLLLTLPPVEAGGTVSVVLTCALVAGLYGLLSRRRHAGALAVTGAVFLAAGGFAYFDVFYSPDAATFGWDLACVLLLLTSLCAVAGALLRNAEAEQSVAIAASAAGWVLLSRLGVLLLTGPTVGMSVIGALTAAWISTAVALMLVGFAKSVPTLRHASFGVVGATVVKIVLVDLAALDPALKAALLMALGLIMVGGGYYYIRARQPT